MCICDLLSFSIWSGQVTALLELCKVYIFMKLLLGLVILHSEHFRSRLPHCTLLQLRDDSSVASRCHYPNVGQCNIPICYCLRRPAQDTSSHVLVCTVLLSHVDRHDRGKNDKTEDPDFKSHLSKISRFQKLFITLLTTLIP